MALLFPNLFSPHSGNMFLGNKGVKLASALCRGVM